MKTALFLALTHVALAEEEQIEAPQEPPKAWGIYDDQTAQLYDHEHHSMVWFSIAGYKKDQEDTYKQNYKETMTQLQTDIEAANPGTKYFVVFFDSAEYMDHAKEGLNCTDIEKKSCISVIQAVKMEDGKEDEMPEEVVYTKHFDEPLAEDKSSNAAAQRKEFLDFVTLIEKGAKKDASDADKDAANKFKHIPSFDSAGEDGSFDDGGKENDDDEDQDPFGHTDEAWARVGHQTMDGCMLQKVGKKKLQAGWQWSS